MNNFKADEIGKYTPAEICDIISNILKSTKIGDYDKVYYIQSFMLHYLSADQIKWIWEN